LFGRSTGHNYCMEPDQLEQTLRDVIIDVCEVLYRHGYRSASVGAIMRLIGVPQERAQGHDDEVFKLDDDFLEELAQRRVMRSLDLPPDATLH